MVLYPPSPVGGYPVPSVLSQPDVWRYSMTIVESSLAERYAKLDREHAVFVGDVWNWLLDARWIFKNIQHEWRNTMDMDAYNRIMDELELPEWEDDLDIDNSDNYRSRPWAVTIVHPVFEGRVTLKMMEELQHRHIDFVEQVWTWLDKVAKPTFYRVKRSMDWCNQGFDVRIQELGLYPELGSVYMPPPPTADITIKSTIVVRRQTVSNNDFEVRDEWSSWVHRIFNGRNDVEILMVQIPQIKRREVT